MGRLDSDKVHRALKGKMKAEIEIKQIGFITFTINRVLCLLNEYLSRAKRNVTRQSSGRYETPIRS